MQKLLTRFLRESLIHLIYSVALQKLKNGKKSLAQGGLLSKAYDCLPHNLLIAKLEVYGVDSYSINLLLDYFSLRKQRTKVGCTHSKWSKIRREIPQASILGPLLFNIFINDIFIIVEQSDICNFADDNTFNRI